MPAKRCPGTGPLTKPIAPIQVDCPHCRRRLQFHLGQGGREQVRLKCPSCEETFLARRPSREPGPGDGRPAQPRRRRGRWYLLAALMTLAGLAAYLLPPGRDSPVRPGVGSLAVVAREPAAGPGEDPWGLTFRAHLQEELRLLGALRLAPFREVERAERDLGLIVEGFPRQASDDLVSRLDALAVSLGVDAVVAFEGPGSRPGTWKGYLRIPARGETLDLEVPEAAAGASDGRDLESLRQLSGGALEEIRSILLPAIPAPPPRDLGFPSTPAALSALGEALGYRWDLEYREAAAAFDLCLEEDPGAWLPAALRARLERTAGDVAAAERFAQRALERAEAAPAAWKLELEALSSEARGREARAAELLGRWAALPGEALEGSLAEARLHIAAGRQEEAKRAVDRALEAEPSSSGDPRLALAAAEVAALGRDFAAQRRAAAAAGRRAQERRAWTWQAAAALQEAEALLGQRDVEGASRAVETAQDLYRRLGDRAGVARSEVAEAILATALGRFPEAGAAFGFALETLEDIGWQGLEATTLAHQARLFAFRGEPEEARRALERSSALHRPLGDRRASIRSGFLASNLLQRMGLWEGAEEALERNLVLARQLRDPVTEARALERWGNLLSVEGDAEGALRRFDEALARLAASVASRAPPVRALRLDAAARLGKADALLQAAELEKSRVALRRAEPRIRGLRDPSLLGRFLLTRAAVALEGERPASSREDLVEAEALLEEQGDPRASSRALILRTRLHLAEGELAKARESLDRLKRGTGDRRLALAARVLEGRLLAAQGRPREAVARLQPLLAEAGAGWPPAALLEVRLALGEALLEEGRPEAAREALESVRKEAQTAGLRLIARRSDRLLRTAPGPRPTGI